MTPAQVSNLKGEELRALAQQLNIAGRSKMKVGELRDAINTAYALRAELADKAFPEDDDADKTFTEDDQGNWHEVAGGFEATLAGLEDRYWQRGRSAKFKPSGHARR